MIILASFLGGWEVVLLLAWPTIWGLGFALWERFRLAPRRSLSPGVPAFFSGVIPAGFALVAAAISFFQGSSRARSEATETLLIALALFVALSVPAFIVFLVSRRLLRTRSTHETPDTTA